MCCSRKSMFDFQYNVRAISSSPKHEGDFALKQRSPALNPKCWIFVPEVMSEPPNSSYILSKLTNIKFGDSLWMLLFRTVAEACQAVRQCHWCLTLSLEIYIYADFIFKEHFRQKQVVAASPRQCGSTISALITNVIYTKVKSSQSYFYGTFKTVWGDGSA